MVRFIFLQRNYLLHFVDSIMQICLSILKWTQWKQWLQQFASSVDSAKYGHSITNMRIVSRLPLSKILILYFHCFEIKSTHLTCKFIKLARYCVQVTLSSLYQKLVDAVKALMTQLLTHGLMEVAGQKLFSSSMCKVIQKLP